MSGQVQRAIAGRHLHIPLNAKVDISQLQVKIYNENERHITDAEVEEKSWGEFMIKFKPPEPGAYTMAIFVANELKHTVMIEADSAPKARLLGSPKLTTFVNQQVEFELEVPGGIKLEQISGQFRRIDDDYDDDVGITTVQNISDTKFVLQFTPNKAGTYHATVGILGQGPMAGDLTVEAMEIPSVTLLTSDGRALVGQSYRWILKISNLPLNQLVALVSAPNGPPKRALVIDNKDGTIDVIYTPERPGVYTVELKINSGTFSNLLQMQAVYGLPQSNQGSPNRGRSPFPSVSTTPTPPRGSPLRRSSGELPASGIAAAAAAVAAAAVTLGSNTFIRGIGNSETPSNSPQNNFRKQFPEKVITPNSLRRSGGGGGGGGGSPATGTRGTAVTPVRSPPTDGIRRSGGGGGGSPATGTRGTAVTPVRSPPPEPVVPVVQPVQIPDPVPPPKNDDDMDAEEITGTVDDQFIVYVDLEEAGKYIVAPVKDELGMVVAHAGVEDGGKGTYKLTFTATQPGLYYMSMIIDGKPAEGHQIFKVSP